MKFERIWFSYIAIALLILLGLFDLVNFGLSLTTISTFVVAILFIVTLHNKQSVKKRD
ncbi:hypothetical protein M5C72_01525 [Companilactobacillus allii]|uniref:hypothetical protein n=1 Tax=Companilactobacillus allii TaxID=1847728 RepID=UPI0012FFB70C|nr:hypothetical protein [Companilactobacillus allii]USQ68941.1 hypothetical protein M5C72_01525 [Companilactobacillus allii]